RNTANFIAFFTSHDISTSGWSSAIRNGNLSYIGMDYQVSSLGSYAFQGHQNAKLGRFPILTSASTGAQSFGNLSVAERLYFPVCTEYRTTTDSNAAFYNLNTGCKLYVDPSM